jgi:hypothetical protein
MSEQKSDVKFSGRVNQVTSSFSVANTEADTRSLIVEKTWQTARDQAKAAYKPPSSSKSPR